MDLLIKPMRFIRETYDYDYYDDDQNGYEDEDQEEVELFIGPLKPTDWKVTLFGEVVAIIHYNWVWNMPGESNNQYWVTLCDPFKTALYENGCYHPTTFSRAIQLITEAVSPCADPYPQ